MTYLTALTSNVASHAAVSLLVDNTDLNLVSTGRESSVEVVSRAQTLLAAQHEVFLKVAKYYWILQDCK